jgi:FAD-linked sulfhydryl oxidase
VHQQPSNVEENVKPNLEIKYTEESNLATSSPQVFGPPMWFTLHNAAAYYPENASPLTKERMKNVIIGLPVLIPCAKCKEHATSYIEKHYNDLDTICSGRDSLFKFFVDFHNYVNQRYNKRIYTYDEAMKLYSGNAKVNKFSYS